MSTTLKETKLIIIGLGSVHKLADWKTGLSTRTKLAPKRALLLKKILLDGMSKSEVSEAEREFYDDVDYQAQGILAERVDSTLAGILTEHDSAHAQYTALCNLLQKLGAGTVDAIDMKMKLYKQTDAKTGIIQTLEEYLKTKRDWINQWSSASGTKMDMADQIKWINLGLSPKLFATQIQIYSSESARKGATLIDFLDVVRNANSIRLGEDDDAQMIVDDRGFAIPLSKSKGFKQQQQNEQFKSKLKCHNCGKLGHFAKECRSKPKAPVNHSRCYGCNQEGHVKRDCPQAKEADPEPIQGKKAWGRSKMAKSSSVTLSDMIQINPNMERVAIDNGSTTSAFNQQEYFIPGTMYQVDRKTTSISGELIQPDSVGTALFRMYSPLVKEYTVVKIEHCQLMNKYPESVISEHQLEHAESLGLAKPLFPKGRLEMYRHGKIWDRIQSDSNDNLFYTHIAPCSEDEIREHSSNVPGKGYFAPVSAKDLAVSRETVHMRFAHPSKDRLGQLVTDLSDRGFEIKGKAAEEACFSCVVAKMRPAPHPVLDSERRLEAKPGERWSHDLSGKMSTKPFGGGDGHYRSIMVDYQSGFYDLQILPSKSDAPRHIYDVRDAVKERFKDDRFTVFKADNAKETNSHELTRILKADGIRIVNSPAYSHQANGDVEVRMRMNENSAITMMVQAGLGKEFWALASQYAAIVDQFVPYSKPRFEGKPNTPSQLYREGHELRGDITPELIRVWGCDVIIYVPPEKRKSMDPRGSLGMFVGIDQHSQSYKVYSNGTLVSTRNVKFFEDRFSYARDRATTPLTTEEEILQFHDEWDANSRLRGVDAVVEDAVSIEVISYQEDEDSDEDDVPILRNNARVLDLFEDVVAEEPVAEQPEEAEEEAGGQRIDYNPKMPGLYNSSDESGNSSTSEDDDSRDSDYKGGLSKAMKGTNDGQVPRSLKEAYEDPNWTLAIAKEIHTLEKSGKLLPIAPISGETAIPVTIRFDIKNDGRKKVRMCARGDLQKQVYGETSSSVVNKVSLKIMLTDAAIEDRELTTFDFSQAFCNSPLPKDIRIFLKIPKNYRKQDGNVYEKPMWWESKMWLYGQVEAAYQWMIALRGAIEDQGFRMSLKDEQVFTRMENKDLVSRIGVHVDDGLLSADKGSTKKVLETLGRKWPMTHEGAKMYAGWDITRDRTRKLIFVSQRTYINKVKHEFGPVPQRTYHTPMDSGFDPTIDPKGDCVKDTVPYGKMIGILMYCCQTRYDIVYATHLLAGYITTCQTKHWVAAKRIFFYIVATNDYVLVLGKRDAVPLEAYADASFARETKLRSRSGGLLQYYGSTISVISNIQRLISLSTAEAEYICLNDVARLSIYGKQLLETMGTILKGPVTVYEDNKSTILLAESNKQHERTKHIALRYHSTREFIAKGQIKIVYRSTEEMVADIFTKPLSRGKFEYFRRS